MSCLIRSLWEGFPRLRIELVAHNSFYSAGHCSMSSLAGLRGRHLSTKQLAQTFASEAEKLAVRY